MSQPSKQEWDDFKQALSGRWGHKHLLCDGYLVAVNIEMCKKRSLHYAIYVNGKMRGEWVTCVNEDELDQLPEESRRFCMHNKKGRSTKEIKQYERLFGKRECKKRGLYKKMIIPLPYWKSINSLIAHFKKHNESISIITYDEYQEKIDHLTKVST